MNWPTLTRLLNRPHARKACPPQTRGRDLRLLDRRAAGGIIVAHALLRAASALLPTLGLAVRRVLAKLSGVGTPSGLAVRQLPSSVQAVEIQNGVEHQKIATFSFRAPERIVGEQQHVAFPVRRIDDGGMLRQFPAVIQEA